MLATELGKITKFQMLEISDPDVLKNEINMGELVIASVQEDRSRAAYSGDLTIQLGWTVKAK